MTSENTNATSPAVIPRGIAIPQSTARAKHERNAQGESWSSARRPAEASRVLEHQVRQRAPDQRQAEAPGPISFASQTSPGRAP